MSFEMSRRLHYQAQAMARKKQREFEENQKWTSTTQYYKSWERKNSHYQNWTSNEYYSNSLDQYKEEEKKKYHKENLEVRRDKLRKLLFDEEKEYEMEMTCSPRQRPERKSVPIEVLKDVNWGLKLAEEDRRRHEAEIKLYHQWRNENPIIRDYESRHRKAGVKLAWLDQQIEKRMEREKLEQETREMIQERERLIREEEELEKKKQQEAKRKRDEMMKQIETKMEQFRLNQELAERYKLDEEKAIKAKEELEDIAEKRYKDMQKRKQQEISLYNINQSRMKLRKKCIDIEEELKHERELIEQINALTLAEEIENKERARQTREMINKCMKCILEHQDLEKQRQKYISFIFDSEAKNLWAKQDRLWREEQEARDKLFDEVLKGIKDQIDEKVQRSKEEQQKRMMERDESEKAVEQMDLQIRKEKEELEQQKVMRRAVLRKQIDNHEIEQRKKILEEEKTRQDELENLRKEEERLKHELMTLQRQSYHPARYNKKLMFW